MASQASLPSWWLEGGEVGRGWFENLVGQSASANFLLKPGWAFLMSGLLWSLVWFLSHEVAYSQNVWLMCEQDQQLRVWFVCGDLAHMATVSMLYTCPWCILQCILGVQSMPQRLAFKLYLELVFLRGFSQQCNYAESFPWTFTSKLESSSARWKGSDFDPILIDKSPNGLGQEWIC